MLHTLLGADGFRKGCDLYFQRHDGQAVTCDDFVNAMEAANGWDLSQFRRWYGQAGTPVISVKEIYNPDEKTLTLTITQSCPPTPGQAAKEPLHIPIAVGLIDHQGKAVTCKLKGQPTEKQEIILQLTASEQSFTFTDLAEKPVVSILRNFSAPVKLAMSRSLDELAFLLSYDSDTFNRWEAGQLLSGQIITGLITDVQQNRPLKLAPIIITAFKQVLLQSWDDLSYCSLLLGLPSESYLAEQMQVVDVEAIHKAREFVVRTLAEHLQKELEDLYLKNHRDESGQFDAGAIGRRRIKNVCLSFLSRLENEKTQQWAEQQFSTARNMTDQIAALATIVNFPHPAKEQCLAQFYQKWQDEALVIDKWFAIQSSSPMPDAFAKVNALTAHPSFDLATPNRVRAVIGSFTQANQLHFHAVNGQGYDFLANHVIALDILNPQVASRMLGPLTSWRRFDETRQNLMKTQLERVMNCPAISRDVYEVASKSLM